MSTVVEAFSPVDGSSATSSGKTNKKQRAATMAVAAAGFSSLHNDNSSGSSTSSPFRGSLSSRQQMINDDFTLRMRSEYQEDYESDNTDDETTATSSHHSSETQARRQFLSTMLAASSAAVVQSPFPQAANAYEQAYPIELTATPYGMPENSSNSLSKLQQERLSNKKAKVEETRRELANDPLGMSQIFESPRAFGLTVGGSTMWGLALWLWLGSRSNPLVTPVANVLYDEKEEQWLKDRNLGYFADLPFSLIIILSAIFCLFGVVLDRAAYFLAEGDAAVSLQLAGVSVIGGAVWEVGRLAAKEKAPTREEYERDVMLYKEFDDFATKRLIVGKGSCHSSDVISAFRRYNPKYRVADSEQYPLADIEIERIFRQWNRQFGSRTEMSSAGFFQGITVDGAADAFAPGR